MVLLKFICLKTMLKSMNSQRHDGTLCDMKILVNDGHVFAHKAVLAAVSPYFQAMFTGGFKERDLSIAEMKMSDVFSDLDTAEEIIRSMYTGQIEITLDNVCAMYSACSFLLYDKPKQLCENFMVKHLSLDTCLDFWEASYHHNMSSKLHTEAIALLKNRFHDHFMYQERLLDAPLSTVSGLLKTDASEYCTPVQILTFLVTWFLQAEVTDIGVLKELVTEVDLPTISNLGHLIDYVCTSSGCMETAKSQRFQDVCAGLLEAFRVEASGQEAFRDTEEISYCMEGRKRYPNTDLSMENGGRSRKIVKRDQEESLGENQNQSFVHSENHGSKRNGMANQSVELSSSCRILPEADQWKSRLHPVCSLAIPSTSAADEWMIDIASHRLSRNQLEKTEKLDGLLAIAPSFTGGVENENEYGKLEYGQLRLCAYVSRSRHWVELAVTDYPVDDNGERIKVSRSQLYAAGGNIYIVTVEGEVFTMRLPSLEWKRVSLPVKENRRRQIFPLYMNDIVFLLIVQDTDDERSDGLTFGMLTEDGIWQEISCCKDDMDTGPKTTSAVRINYGPCWAENGCFLIQMCKGRAGRSLFIGVLCFDPTEKEVMFIPYNLSGDYDSVYYDPYTNRAQKSLFFELDNWVYFWRTDMYSVAIEARFRTSEDGGVLEKHSIKFRNYIEKFRPFHSCPMWLNHEDPKNNIFAATGSCLWYFVNTNTGQSILASLNINTPDDVIEHTPPPCNLVLAATGACLNSFNLADKSIARYSRVHFRELVREDISDYEDYIPSSYNYRSDGGSDSEEDSEDQQYYTIFDLF